MQRGLENRFFFVNLQSVSMKWYPSITIVLLGEF